MKKAQMPRVTEPDEGLVHYVAPPLADAVTLCGRTDWIGVTAGRETDAPINCRLCRSIKTYCDSYAPHKP